MFSIDPSPVATFMLSPSNNSFFENTNYNLQRPNKRRITTVTTLEERSKKKRRVEETHAPTVLKVSEYSNLIRIVSYSIKIDQNQQSTQSETKEKLSFTVLVSKSKSDAVSKVQELAETSKLTNFLTKHLDADIKEIGELDRRTQVVSQFDQLFDLYHENSEGTLVHTKTNATLPFSYQTFSKAVQMITKEHLKDLKGTITSKGLYCEVDGHVFEAINENGKLIFLYQLKEIGAGGSSIAYLTIELCQGNKMVLKVAKQTNDPEINKRIKQDMLDEAEIIKKIHRLKGAGELFPGFVAPPLTTIQNEGCDFLGTVYQHYNGGDLIHFLKLFNNKLTTHNKITIALKIWDLFLETAKWGIYPPDIKLSNILVKFESNTINLALNDLSGTKLPNEPENFSRFGLSPNYRCPILDQKLRKARDAKQDKEFRELCFQQLRYMFSVCLLKSLSVCTKGPDDKADLLPRLPGFGIPSVIVNMITILLDPDPNKRSEITDSSVRSVLESALSNIEGSAEPGMAQAFPAGIAEQLTQEKESLPKEEITLNLVPDSCLPN